MKQTLLVGLGAALGALSRYGLTELISNTALSLIIINALGSFAMGYARPNKFWGTGFLGGFTSFSAFAVLLITPTMSLMAAISYGAATIILCVGGWFLGDVLRDAHQTRSSLS